MRVVVRLAPSETSGIWVCNPESNSVVQLEDRIPPNADIPQLMTFKAFPETSVSLILQAPGRIPVAIASGVLQIDAGIFRGQDRTSFAMPMRIMVFTETTPSARLSRSATRDKDNELPAIDLFSVRNHPLSLTRLASGTNDGVYILPQRLTFEEFPSPG
jgi:hypothetical protein